MAGTYPDLEIVWVVEPVDWVIPHQLTHRPRNIGGIGHRLERILIRQKLLCYPLPNHGLLKSLLELEVELP